MNKSQINLDLASRSYNIEIGSNIRQDLPKYLADIGNFSKIFIITDENVAKLHLDELSNILEKSDIDHHKIILKAGEKTKDFSNLQNLCEEILSKSIDRNSLLIAFGGGVIGDLCGFVASILLRGINFIQIPTTLLSAVDSSVGGKTAINSKFGKNLIGSFYQPKLVLCDVDYLQTLTKRDYFSGYGEVIKYGLIDDKIFFSFLENNIDKIKNRDPEILQEIIVESCNAKAKIVSQDETEQGKRALLNFGHTFGHIFETATKYSDELLHGEAVAIGMVMAGAMSRNLGLIDNEDVLRIKKHLKEVGLFSSPKEVRKKWNKKELTSYLYKDKKVKDNKLTFILLNEIGHSFIQKDVEEELFLEVLEEFI